MRRLFWVGVGAATTVAALRKARELTETHVPAGARSALGAVSGLASLAQTVRTEFSAGMAQREAELRADLLAGADPVRSRQAVDAWRAQRAGDSDATGHDGVVAGDDGPHRRGDAAPGTRPGTARPGSAAAARGTGAHRAEDPDDGAAGYSFF